MALNHPLPDSFPEPPEDWEAIPLGPGQEPNAYGGNNSFQWRTDADSGTTIDDTAVRRNPDETFVIIGRWPERP